MRGETATNSVPHSEIGGRFFETALGGLSCDNSKNGRSCQKKLPPVCCASPNEWATVTVMQKQILLRALAPLALAVVIKATDPNAE